MRVTTGRILRGVISGCGYLQVDLSKNGARECARQLGLNPSHISEVLKGKRKTVGGYTFKYKEG